MKTALTDLQYAKFVELVNGVSSQNNGTRVLARLDMRRFVEKHGKEVCDRAFEKLTGRKKR